jgi:hypothetical protein
MMLLQKNTDVSSPHVTKAEVCLNFRVIWEHIFYKYTRQSPWGFTKNYSVTDISWYFMGIHLQKKS